MWTGIVFLSSKSELRLRSPNVNSSSKVQFEVKEKLTKAPPNLSSIQCLGALSLFRCFFKPRAWDPKAPHELSPWPERTMQRTHPQNLKQRRRWKYHDELAVLMRRGPGAKELQVLQPDRKRKTLIPRRLQYTELPSWSRRHELPTVLIHYLDGRS